MIIKGQNVIGLNVVTIDTGTVVQSVDDIAYDPINHRIVALLVDSGGLFSSAKAIHMDDVHNIGEDAVIVHDASAVQSIKDLGEDVRSISDSNKHLVKTNVLTSDGKELGKVTDIYFDSSTGEVDSMEVSQGGLKTMTEGKKSIKPADIVTIGADATIVSNYTELKLDAQGEEGGLKGAFNDAKDKATELAASAKETAEDITETTKEKANEFKEVAADKAEDLKAVAKEKADEAQDKAKELSDQARVKSAELQDVAEDKIDEAKEVIDRKTAEARVKASELQEDISEKTDDLAAATRSKANELQRQANNASDEIKVKAQELADDAQDKGEELSEVARQKSAETKAKVNDLAETGKERIQNGTETLKDKADNAIATADHKGGKVVEQTTHHYEDQDKQIDTKKTVVKKK